MDNLRPHLTTNSAGADVKSKKKERVVVENGVVYEFIPDEGEEWDSDEGELEADYFPTDSVAELDKKDGFAEERGRRRRLHDARVDEPRTTEFTMTKFDRHARKIEGLREVWRDEVVRGSSPGTEIAGETKKKKKEKKQKSKGKAKTKTKETPFGTPLHNYDTYHASTVAALRPDAEALETLYHTYKLRRRILGQTVSEKSSMVNLKAGDTLEKMVEEMITPGPEEIGEQAFREAEADRRIEREEEKGWDEEIEGSRGRVGVEGWGGRNWGKRGS